MRALWITPLLLTGLCLTPAAAQKQPFTFDAMMQVKRISDPQLSPDGRMVAFTVAAVDMDKNATARQIWIVPVDGGSPRQLTTEGNNSRPRWSPDSRRISFLSSRSGSQQIWVMNADGSGARQLTSLATEADGHIWTPDGEHFVFTSQVYPECADMACNERRLEEEKQSKVKARIYTSLLYRHWAEWKGKRRKHLMVIPAGGGAARDLTPGFIYDVPPFSLAGGEDYAVSPDGKEVAYAAKLDEDQATSTNSDIYVVPVEGGEARKVSTSAGADNTPAYSPDGKWLAWRMQQIAGYESDRWRLVVMDRETGVINSITETIDRNVDAFSWHPDSKRIAYVLEDRGRHPAQIIGVNGGGARAITRGSSSVGDLQFTPDGRSLIYTEQSGSSPVEIFRAMPNEGAPVALTRLNDGLLARHGLQRYEEFTVAGAEGAQVHGFLVKPPGFDPGKRYPVLMLIHGGPQGAWGESFSYRWNPQVFAAAGFVVALPNPRGSTGYGQRFTDEINADWGGRVYEDLMYVADYLASLPYTDGERMAAAGGSYGGYMVNWILGHTNRFRALVSHAGVYDLRSMGGETEELWFTKWEFKGYPWETPEIHERWSPSVHAARFRTPTLVIHGELDFRVPYGQGLQLFTALQANKVPSKLLLYPDEGHWILKPQNSRLWYEQFLEWVTEWTRERGGTN